MKNDARLHLQLMQCDKHYNVFGLEGMEIKENFCGVKNGCACGLFFS